MEHLLFLLSVVGMLSIAITGQGVESFGFKLSPTEHLSSSHHGIVDEDVAKDITEPEKHFDQKIVAKPMNTKVLQTQARNWTIVGTYSDKQIWRQRNPPIHRGMG